MKHFNKRKVVSLMIAFALVFFMAGCDKTEPSITGEGDLKVLVGTDLLDLSGIIELTDAKMDDVVIDYSNVDMNTVGTYVVTYTIEVEGEDPVVFELNVEVVDYPLDSTPLLYGVEDIIYVIDDEIPNLLIGVTAIDREFGNLTSHITVDSSNVDFTKVGNYEITYYVSNADGYNQFEKANVNVVLNDELYEFTSKFIIANNGLYGVTDDLGNIIVPFEYKYISYIGDDILRMVKDNGLEEDPYYRMSLPVEEAYYYNLETKEFITYEYYFDSYFRDDFAVVRNDHGLYTYMNTSGDLLMPFIYSRARDFIDGRAIVKMGENYGVIDKMGNQVIEVKYDDVTNFSEGYFLKTIENKFFIVDGNDETLLELSSGEYTEYSESVKYGYDEVFYKVEIDGYLALVNKDIEVVLYSEFNQLSRYRYNYFYGRDENYIMSLYNYKTGTVLPNVDGFNLDGDIFILSYEEGTGLYDSATETFTLEPTYSHLRRFDLNEDLFIATREDGMKAIIDKNGIIITDFVIESLENYASDNFVIFNDANDNKGTIGADGLIVSQPIYSYIGAEYNGFSIMKDSSTQKYGYLDNTGAQHIIPVFYESYNFDDGYARVKRADLEAGWTLISDEGIFVSSSLYLGVFNFENGYAKVRVENQHGMVQYKHIDEDGNELTTESYAYLSNMEDGYAIADVYLIVSSMGLINSDGEVVLPLEYFNVNYPSDGMIRVTKDDGRTYYYNIEDEEFISESYEFGFDFHEGRAVVGNSYGENAIIDEEGNVIKDYSSNTLKYYSQGVIVSKNYYIGGYELLDLDGEVIEGSQYSQISTFNTSLTRVGTMDGVWGFIDNSGQMVIEAVYSSVNNFTADSIYTTVVGNTYGPYNQGIIDINGNVIFETRYSVSNSNQGFELLLEDRTTIEIMLEDDVLTYNIVGANGVSYTMKYDGGWTLSDGTTILVDKGYDSIEYLEDTDMWVVTKDGKFGLLDELFNVILEPIYDGYGLEAGGLYIDVELDGNYGAYSLEGTEIIPPIYDDIRFSEYTKTFMVYNGDVKGIYSFNGTVMLEVEFYSIQFIDRMLELILK